MTVLALALGCARGTRPSASEAVGKGTVYSGPGGEMVTLVPLMPAESRKFLLYFQGTKDDVDGKVLLHKASPELTEFYAHWKGRELRFFHVDRRSHSERHTLNVPNREDVVSVQLDEARTLTLKAEDIYELYQRQLADGTSSRGEQFDRKYWMESEQREFAVSVQALNEACRTPVEVRILWDTVSDTQLTDEDISGSCTPPLEALRDLCSRSEEARRTVRSRVKSLDCRIGETLEPRVEAERVVWTTPVGSGAPSREETLAFFLDNL